MTTGGGEFDGWLDFEELELIYFAAKAVKNGKPIEHENIEVVE